MLILAGVGFKVSAAPFHMWAPDAYEGAPLPITALLSTLSKAAGFALFLRLFGTAFSGRRRRVALGRRGLSAITMTVGNLIAIQQSNLKRLVAYSSISQVGYMLIVIAAIGYGDAGGRARCLLRAAHPHRRLRHFDARPVQALTAYYNKTRKDSIERPPGMAETAPVPGAGRGCSAVLVRRPAVLRGLRDEALPVPVGDHRRNCSGSSGSAS
jgi:NADH-quinone oxidoreductase subunit N